MDSFIPLQVGRKVILSVQDPIELGEHSEPQPDLTVLKPRPDFYAKAHPGPADVFLVVEVAETSAAYDRDMKVPLYAQAGVVRRGQRLAPEAFPHLDVAVGDVLG
jgi:Uma2 family endonuclease